MITGFALDKRAFSLLQLESSKVQYRFIDLIPVIPGETLGGYARRLGQEMGIQQGDILGGVSLGGMLALEMAEQYQARGVILIASCTHPKQIRKRFLFFAPIAPFVPDFIIRRIFLLIPQILKWQKMLSPEGQSLLADIMGHFPPSLLRTLPPLIKNWSGKTPPMNFRHLHSEGDWLIRPKGTPETLRKISGKNHLITVSHPEEVRSFLEDSVKEFLRTESRELSPDL